LFIEVQKVRSSDPSFIQPLLVLKTELFELALVFLLELHGQLTIMNGGHEAMPFPNCPKCNSEYTYEDRDLLVCPNAATSGLLNHPVLKMRES